MKATRLLEKQHRKVEGIFEELEMGVPDTAAELLELANDLAAHMAIEQDLFYPAVREIDPKLIGESYEEHAIAELALKRLLATADDDPTFAPKVTALKELILRHVEEEEKELFPKVEHRMDPEELEALGDQMSAAFEEALSGGYEALLAEGLTASADGPRQAPKVTRPERTKKRTTAKRPPPSAH
jgi:hemerythrin superfamily protein